jgi:hypothetical protein
MLGEESVRGGMNLSFGSLRRLIIERRSGSKFWRC